MFYQDDSISVEHIEEESADSVQNSGNWMQALAEHWQRMRLQYPGQQLAVVFDDRWYGHRYAPHATLFITPV